jgi:CHAT domain-containing protein/Tfp pilus assembly protein PilF
MKFYRHFVLAVLTFLLGVLPVWVSFPETRATAIAPAATVAISLDRAETLYEAGQWAEAVQIWEQLAEEFNRTSQTREEVLCYGYLAIAYQELGRWDAAETAIARAVSLLERVDDPAISARVFNAKGSLLFNQGDVESALETWKTAEGFYRAVNDIQGTLSSQINQAQALQNLGLYRQAQIVLERVQADLADLEDSSLKAAGLRSLGMVLQVVGDLPRSRQILSESLAIARRIHSPPDMAAALLQLGNTARSLNDIDAAFQFYQEAAEKTSGGLIKIQAQLNQFSLSIDSDRQEDAVALVPQIQGSLSQIPPSRARVYARVNFADSLMEMSAWDINPKPEKETIASLLAIAVQEARELNDNRATAYALGQLAHLYENTGQHSEALELTESALGLVRDIQDADLLAILHWQQGRIFKQTGQIDEAIAAYEQAVNAIESLRQDLVAVNSEVRFDFRDEIEPVYRQFVELMLQEVDALPPQLKQNRLKRSREAIEALQLRALENFFQESCQSYKSRSIEEVDSHAAAFYTISLDHSLEVILSIPGQPLQHYRTVVSAEEKRTADWGFSAALNPIFQHQEVLAHAQTFYNWLIEPAEPALAAHEIETLVFVLDDFLRNLPMSVLHDGDRFLIEKYNIVLTPGLQLFESPALSPERINALTGGLAEARQGFSALPSVPIELDNIEDLIPARVLLNEQFTKQSVEKQIASNSVSVVHLATHGQFSSNAEETFLLTWDDRINVKDLDKLLKRSQNQTLIELLVLSACQTARGDNRASLGLAGVAVRSGARSTLATLWSVNDRSTAEFMAEFYRLLRQGASKAAAVRQAQLFLLNNPQYQHPYYWSPFVLVGNWQ